MKSISTVKEHLEKWHTISPYLGIKNIPSLLKSLMSFDSLEELQNHALGGLQSHLYHTDGPE